MKSTEKVMHPLFPGVVPRCPEGRKGAQLDGPEAA